MRVVLTEWLLTAFLAFPAVALAADAAPGLPPGLEMLRRTERGFAKATSEIGVRNGFLMFFAPDAIAPPSTEPARKGLLAIPAPVEPRPTTLAWEPLLGDIARSGDLGYLTGPSSYSDRAGKRHEGVYFSVWRRDDMGLWRVILDAGIDMPSPAAEFENAAFHAAADSGWAGGAAGADSSARIAGLEKTAGAFASAAGRDVAAALKSFMTPNARMHRDGMHPLLGRGAILAHLGASRATLKITPVRADVSAANDLGWTFGTCEWTADQKTVKGTLSQVWKRDPSGAWKIVLDVLSPAQE